MADRDDSEPVALEPTLASSDPALSPTVAAHVDPALAPTVGGAVEATGDLVDGGGLTPEHSGRYERREEVGRGGMGRVLVVYDEHLGREVAMKELLIQSEGSSSGAGVTLGVVARFLREARITGQLEHPNIVPVHELGRRADGTLYYTMKRIRGRSFATVLREAKTLEDRLKLLPRFRDVCEAVAYAHARGVVHRDIKPDNVMVGEFGETLVVDWGLAKVRGEDDVRGRDIERRVNLMKEADAASTIDGHAIGTPAYMSPEQARGDLPSIDERSDVWGLGAMLFEILAGRPPYEGAKALSVLQKVLDEPAPRVRDVHAAAPPELAAIADRALLRDPSSRYPDARALAHEIVAYEEGRQVHAYHYSALEQLRRFVSRHKAASVAALVVTLAVLFAVIVSTAQYREERAARTIAVTRRDEALTRQHAAEDAVVEARARLARALLEHAERSLDEGDPSAAAIYAAGALVHDPANPSSPEHAATPAGDDAEAAARRVTRALSAYLDAEDARRFVFVRRVAGATSRGALSPDGRTLVFPAGPQLVVEPATGGERRTLDLQATRVLGFLDADRAVVDGEEPMVLRLSNGAHLHPLPAGAASFARMGDAFALGMRDGEVIVLDASDYTERARFDASVAEPLVRAAGDLWLVAGTGTVSGFAADGTPTETHTVASPVQALAPSPDGVHLVVGLSAPAVELLALPGLTRLPPIAAEGPVADAAWLGRSLVVSAEGPTHVVVRNVATRQRLDTLHVTPNAHHRVHASSRHSLIVALPSATGRELPSATVFRFERHRQRRTRPMASSVHDVVVDARRARVVVATMRSVASLPITRRGLGEVEPLAPLPDGLGTPARLAVSRDGAIAMTSDRGALVLLEPGAEAMRVLRAPREGAPCPLPVAFAADGSIVFSATPEGPIERHPRQGTRVLARLEGHEGAACGLSLSEAGDALASAGLDGTLRIWNVSTSELERSVEHPDARLTDVAFAPGGERLALVDDEGRARVVRRVDGLTAREVVAHEERIRRVAWSGDGTHFATAGADGTLRYFSADGRLVRVIRTRGAARSLEFSARDNFLYFGDASHVVRLRLGAQGDTTNPEGLLERAESRGGLRLDGLELVPQ